MGESEKPRFNVGRTITVIIDIEFTDRRKQFLKGVEDYILGKSISHGVAEKSEADEETFTADSRKRSTDSKDLTCLGQGRNWSGDRENEVGGGRQIGMG